LSHLAQLAQIHLCVNDRRIEGTMAEDIGHLLQIGTFTQQTAGQRVAKGVGPSGPD
jgi:hypothetical protein